MKDWIGLYYKSLGHKEIENIYTNRTLNMYIENKKNKKSLSGAFYPTQSNKYAFTITTYASNLCLTP